jgi:hypothetical protein
MTYLSHLYTLMREDYARKHPGVPEYALPKPSFKVKTANGLTKAVIAWIQLHGGQAERISVTGRMLDQRKNFIDVLGHHRTVGSVKWISPSMQKGTADVSCTIKPKRGPHAGIGFSVKIEIKIKKDRQSEYQKKYQHEVESSGGIYLIFKDFESFGEWFEKFENGTI